MSVSKYLASAQSCLCCPNSLENINHTAWKQGYRLNLKTNLYIMKITSKSFHGLNLLSSFSWFRSLQSPSSPIILRKFLYHRHYRQRCTSPRTKDNIKILRR